MNSHELTFFQVKKFGFLLQKQTFHILSNMIKVTSWYCSIRPFQAIKKTHILHYNNTPELDSFQEVPLTECARDRICPTLPYTLPLSFVISSDLKKVTREVTHVSYNFYEVVTLKGNLKLLLHRMERSELFCFLSKMSGRINRPLPSPIDCTMDGSHSRD